MGKDIKNIKTILGLDAIREAIMVNDTFLAWLQKHPEGSRREAWEAAIATIETSTIASLTDAAYADGFTKGYEAALEKMKKEKDG